MASNEQADQINLAIATELARQLCHDFNNFLYNLFLQIDITAAAPEKGGNWDGIKRAGAKIVQRLREWDRFQRRFSFDEAPVDLHELLRGVVAEIKSEDRPISLGFSPKVGPLCVGTSRPDCRHLLRLLMEDTMDIWMGANGEPPKVSIETEQIDSTAIIRINAAGGGEGNPPDAGSESE